MNSTKTHNIPVVGFGKIDNIKFSWSISRQWVKITFHNMLSESNSDVEVECRLGDDGYFNLFEETQVWWKVNGNNSTELPVAEYSNILTKIKPFFDDNYAM
jgi:hypothetical protein